MSRLTIITAFAIAVGAVLVAGSANSLTTRLPAPIVVPASPAAQIDVFELMGKALAELPAEHGSMH